MSTFSHARSVCFAVTVVLAAALVPSDGSAAGGSARGTLLGVSLHSNHIGSDDRPPDAPSGSVFLDENGGGLTLVAGYGFTNAFALRLALDGAVHETTDPAIEVTHSSVVMEGVYYFRSAQLARPYVAAGVGGFQVESRQGQYDFATTGPGAVLGTGLQVFVAEHVALDFGLRADWINWEEQRATRHEGDGTETIVQTPIEEEGGAVKLRVGVNFWI